MSTELNTFLAAKNRPSRLIGDVERYILARPAGDRSTTVLHPSEIIKDDWCHRASYFLLKGVTKTPERIGLRLQNIFDEGHAIHAKWQRRFQDMGVLHGQFRCQVCDEITWGTSPDQCASCTAPMHALYYEEVTLRDNDLRISGHTDGWIKGIGDDCLIEIKSIGPGTLRSEAPNLMHAHNGDFMKAFSNVRRPFTPHVLQGQMYLELMKRMGNPIDEIVFIYELKADQSYKEFVVKSDYGSVAHIFEGAEEVVSAVNSNKEPECTNKPGGTCKQCSSYLEN